MFLDIIVKQVLTTVAPMVITAVTQAHQTPPQQPLPPLPEKVKEGAVVDAIKQEMEQDPKFRPKPWYQSVTLWGGVAALVLPIISIASGGRLNFSADDAADITSVLAGLAGAIGGAVAIIGRVRATRSVGVGRRRA